MTLLDAVISALDALRLHKLRSALTMLGIIIGVAAVIAMVAVGGGAREQVVAQIRSLGANLLIITPGNITQGGVRLGQGAASTLTDEDSAAIMKEVAGVQVTAPYMRGAVQLIAGGSQLGERPRSASISAGSRRANGTSSPAACSRPRRFRADRRSR